MIDTPTIVRTEATPVAVIRFTIPRSEIRQVMGPAITEVIATVSAQGIGPTGPVFSHHLRMDPEVFDFEVGVPVTSPVTPAGRVQPGELPAATVARTVHHGPYEELGRAWGEFDAWLKSEGHEPAPHLWESYLSGPETSADPSAWRTELNRPVAQADLGH